MEDNLPGAVTKRDHVNTAWRLFFAGDRKEALAIASNLVANGYMPAYMLLGLINEYGGGGVDVNLPQAVACYRQLSTAIPSDVSYICLARAHLKIGTSKDLDRVQAYLALASEFRRSGALYLALGAYHECRDEWILSARYNLYAVFYGRLLGMRRAADALSMAGYRPVAWLLRGAQFIIGLPLRLMLGKKSIEDF